MTDHTTIDTLREAFDELERRCDAYRPAPPTPLRRRPRTTALLIAASVAVVVALAVLAATRLGLGPNQPRAAAGGASPAAPSAALTTPPTQHRSATAHRPVRGRPASSAAGHHAAPPNGPARTDSISRTFTAVLHRVAGNSATFTTAPESNGTFLLGELTVHGVTGGFDLQYFHAGRGQRATCDDMDRVQCHVSSPPGGSLATGSENLQTDPGGVTRQAVYVRADGTEFVMHVSNAADPKGAGSVGPEPPLTIDQMVAVVTSPQW